MGNFRFNAPSHESAAPEACKSRAEREEDEFMKLHGGRGNRAIYRIVLAVESCAGWAGRTIYAATAGTVRRLRKPASAPVAGNRQQGGDSG